MLMAVYRAFAVGFVANLYGRFFSGNAFVIMVRALLSAHCNSISH